MRDLSSISIGPCALTNVHLKPKHDPSGTPSDWRKKEETTPQNRLKSTTPGSVFLGEYSSPRQVVSGKVIEQGQFRTRTDSISIFRPAALMHPSDPSWSEQQAAETAGGGHRGAGDRRGGLIDSAEEKLRKCFLWMIPGISCITLIGH